MQPCVLYVYKYIYNKRNKYHRNLRIDHGKIAHSRLYLQNAEGLFVFRNDNWLCILHQITVIVVLTILYLKITISEQVALSRVDSIEIA